jgi:uncharacterized protein YndB with AHSA1/START domain
VRVTTTIQAGPQTVWAHLADLSSHVEWMADAEAIRFTTPQRRGVGTSFECDTRVGPFHLVDRMEVTEWDEGRVIGVRHCGLVSGTGRFTLERLDRGERTRFTWEEELAFPWRLATPVLGAIWRRNLTRLKTRIEAGAATG